MGVFHGNGTSCSSTVTFSLGMNIFCNCVINIPNNDTVASSLSKWHRFTVVYLFSNLRNCLIISKRCKYFVTRKMSRPPYSLHNSFGDSPADTQGKIANLPKIKENDFKMKKKSNEF